MNINFLKTFLNFKFFPAIYLFSKYKSLLKLELKIKTNILNKLIVTFLTKN